jgi:hypothetical protein
MRYIPLHTFDYNFERTEFSDENYSLVGRALTYATKFEKEVKVLESMFYLKSNNGILNDEKALKEFIKRIEKFTLNQSIKELGFESDIENILMKAKNARNFIAHELTIDLIDSADTSEEREYLLETLKNKITEIAEAEKIILLIQTISNKEELPDVSFFKEYSKKITDWVIDV